MISKEELKLRLVQKYGTLSAAAAACGLSQPSLHQFLTTKPIPLKRVAAIANAAGLEPSEISEDYAAAFHSTRVRPLAVFETKTDLDPPEPGDWTADVHDIELSAGNGGFIPEFVETRYKHTFSEDWRLRKGIKNGEKLYRHKVRGNSMYPVVGDGDVVLIRPSDKTVIDRRTYAIVVAGQLKIKKLARRRDGALEILSCNPEYQTEVVPSDELDTVYIIGRVIDKSGDSGLDG